MKKLFVILMFLAVKGYGQITYTPMGAGGYSWGYTRSDSGTALPFRDTTTGRGTRRPGPLVSRPADSLPYYWNGKRWYHILISATSTTGGGTGGGGDSIVTLQDAFDNDLTAIPKINAHNQSFNVDSAIGISLTTRSSTINGKLAQLGLSPGSYSIQNYNPQSSGYGSTISSNDSIIFLLSNNDTQNGRIKLTPTTASVSRGNGTYKPIVTSFNGVLADPSGNITIDFTSNPPNPNDPISDTVEGVSRFYIGPDFADSGRLKRFYTDQLPRGIDTAYAATDTTEHFSKIVNGVAVEWDVKFKKDSAFLISSFTKNVGGDSTILTLVNGTRYAAFDRTGGGGTTDYQIQTASGATTFTFTGLPASLNDYIIFRNGAKIRQTTDYTASGTTVTIPAIITGDKVEYQRIK